MTVILDVPPEKEAVFKAQAEARGLGVGQWILEVAEQHTQHCASIVHLQKTNPAEWARHFRVRADSHDAALPVLTEDAMSRESIY